MILRDRISIYISNICKKKLLFLALFLLGTLTTTAQQKKMKYVAIVDDSVPTFRGVAVQMDLIGPLELATSDYGQVEGALRFNLKDKYFPVMEIGYGKADASDVTTGNNYKTSAPYGKIGCDFNVLKNKHDIHRMYVGFRYAYTSFKYDVYNPDMKDPVWRGHANYEAIDVKANYNWLEGVVMLDAKIWKNIRMGWSVRYRRRLIHKNGSVGNPWYVPGYGRCGNSRLGGTFNITIEF